MRLIHAVVLFTAVHTRGKAEHVIDGLLRPVSYECATLCHPWDVYQYTRLARLHLARLFVREPPLATELGSDTTVLQDSVFLILQGRGDIVIRQVNRL